MCLLTYLLTVQFVFTVITVNCFTLKLLFVLLPSAETDTSFRDHFDLEHFHQEFPLEYLWGFLKPHFCRPDALSDASSLQQTFTRFCLELLQLVLGPQKECLWG